MTKQRKLVYDIVTEKPVHMTAEEIYLKARARMPGIAMGTVYRNLGLMADQGLIRRLELPGTPARFDRQAAAHPHLVCERCGAVTDLVFGPDFREDLRARCGRPLTGFDLTLYHVCDNCKTD